jgi:CPA2 family monovalent cation:H+ antiporter-2
MSSASRWRAVAALTTSSAGTPVGDTFAAAFFFAFGLTIDAGDARQVVGPVVAVVLSIVLNLAAGVIAAPVQGFGRTAAANIGFTSLGRGEFTLILATLATAAGLDDRIGPFGALYVLTLAILGLLLAARSSALVRVLPGRWSPEQPGAAGVMAIPGRSDG